MAAGLLKDHDFCCHLLICCELLIAVGQDYKIVSQVVKAAHISPAYEKSAAGHRLLTYLFKTTVE